jgi:hypothetical protein
MILEAVWLKNGKEIAWVNPVWEVENLDDGSSFNSIRVNNGFGWYSCDDLTEEELDDFILRISR